MERIGGVISPPGNGLTRVTDLERSQQWTSLASDINDLERSRMRTQRQDADPRKRMLHRRSMPEPQQTSMIYVDVNTEDYGTHAEKYFLPIGSDSHDESVDSWSWRPDSAGNSTSEKSYLLYSNNNNNNNNDNNNYESYGSRGEGNGTRKGDCEEVEAYRGSREKLHEIFRRNRDLRRKFFADVPLPEFKQEKPEAGSGYGSVETLTSQSNHSETGSGNVELTAAARKNTRNLKYATLVDQTSSLREFGGSARDRREKLHFSLPRRGTRRSEAFESSVATPSGNGSLDFDGNHSPPPPLPASEPPASISADESLISGDFPDTPERLEIRESKDADQSAFHHRRFDADRSIYKPESEGLKMLDRFEACIEQRKQPSIFSRSNTVYKSLPNLAHTGSNRRSGTISRLAINGSTVDLDLSDKRIRPAALKRGREPEEIRATRVDLENLRLGDRRRGIPPPLDLSKVSEALRREDLRWDRRVLRDYSLDETPLQNDQQPIKCTVTVVEGAEVRKPRPSAGQATLETATSLIGHSRNAGSSGPSVPVRAEKILKDEEISPTASSGVPNRFRSSVVVWCDGKDAAKDLGNRETDRMMARRTNLEHRKSTGSLRPVTGNVFPSVYAPIPYKSPRRYVEGEVTIHYRSPVRTEAKEVLSEAELARRSAENMRRVYQEERRRKYLQELHDIDSRRHTDNFTPSQKSPIPLNRYDDFVDDLSHRSRSQEQTPEPRLVAKALYNFVGQSSRELTFRRGDIIFVRRQVDKNWYEGEHNAMIGLFPFNYVEILPYDGIRTTTTPKKPYEGQARAKFNFVAQTTHELSLLKGDLVVLTRRVDENWYEGRIGNRKGIFPISYVEVLVEPGIRSETPAQNKPVAAPAAHSLLSNGSAGGKLSMGPHHYTPSIPTNTNASQSHYNSLPRVGGSKLHVAPVNETLHIDTHSEPLRYRALYNYRPQNDDELELKEGDTVYVMEKCDDGWFVGSSQRTGCFGTFPGNYVERL